MVVVESDPKYILRPPGALSGLIVGLPRSPDLVGRHTEPFPVTGSSGGSSFAQTAGIRGWDSHLRAYDGSGLSERCFVVSALDPAIGEPGGIDEASRAREACHKDDIQGGCLESFCHAIFVDRFCHWDTSKESKVDWDTYIASPVE
ncbi:hypothetical protein HOY80DRAFT_1044261 [Tuber brumale]|nr:hypothetical protein HOY80DRAFT_1044261 [Tuber brumale]